MTITAHSASIIIREARKDFASIQRTIQDWNDMADECQRQGYRPQYCIHGTNAWTDYDNICPGCEDGYHPQDITYMDVLKDTLDAYRRASAKLQASRDQILKINASMRAMGLSDQLISDTILKTIGEILGRFAN